MSYEFQTATTQLRAYVLVGVSHHHMVVGRTHEIVCLRKQATPLPNKAVPDLLRTVVPLEPEPQPTCYIEEPPDICLHSD